jgi:AmmeMemoRadiSam system protein B
MGASKNVRPSPIVGTWYPGDEAALTRSIDGFLSDAQSQPVLGLIKAVIVPHAGHQYSGGVAAYAYNSIRELHPKTVAVISPFHQYYPARLLTTEHDAYETPLGLIPVNRDLVLHLSRVLMMTLGDGLTPIGRDREHSLEIQLPFLQRVYPDGFNLLPVMLRDQSAETAHALADALVQVLPEDSLLIASSDLSHFFTEKDARQLDGAVLKAIQDLSPEDLYRVEAESKGFACGLGAIACVLWAASKIGANQVDILNQATSGDITGDRSSVVGYASAVVYQTL